MASLGLAYLLAQSIVRSSSGAFRRSATFGNGSRPSARVGTLEVASATSSRSSEQVEHGVCDPACRPLGRSTSPFEPAKQRFEDDPFFIGEVGRVAW